MPDVRDDRTTTQTAEQSTMTLANDTIHRDDLVVAVFDVETANDETEAGGWPEGHPGGINDGWRFAVGVVRWLHLRRTARRRVSYAVLAQNVYWSPVAMLDDLYQPWHHALVGWNAHAFDLPVLVGSAVPPLPGPYQVAPSPADVVAVARRMRAAHLDGWPLVVLGRSTAYRPPTGWVERALAWWQARGLEVSTRTAREAEQLAAWVMAHRYSRMYPAGVVGLGRSREEHMETLRARTFDPLRFWAEETGHPHVVSLRDMHRAFAKAKSGASSQKATGDTGDHAGVPSLWQRGLMWSVVETCDGDVDDLAEVLHTGLNANKLGVDGLRTSYRNREGALVEAPGVMGLRSQAEGGLYEYHLPTTGWWNTLETIANLSRQRRKTPQHWVHGIR